MRIARFRKPLTIALDPGVYDRVKQITDEENRSMADWVREAVDEALGKQPNDLAKLSKLTNGNGGK
jgi:hypothetical protein